MIKGFVGGGRGGRKVKGGIFSRTKGGEYKENDGDPTPTNSERDIGCKEILIFPSDCNHCTKPADMER